MDSGPEHDSANGDEPTRRRRRRTRTAEERRAEKEARQARKREEAGKRIGERERALGGKREGRRERKRRLVPAPPGPPENGDKRAKPKLRKLRFAFILLGLTVLAFVAWIFGIMMAVAQDLPSLEARQQYKSSVNS